jgi:hypothetical protein
MTCLWEVKDGDRTVGKFLSGNLTVRRAERPLQKIAMWPNGEGKATSLVFDECLKRGWKCTLHTTDYKPPKG